MLISYTWSWNFSFKTVMLSFLFFISLLVLVVSVPPLSLYLLCCCPRCLNSFALASQLCSTPPEESSYRLGIFWANSLWRSFPAFRLCMRPAIDLAKENEFTSCGVVAGLLDYTAWGRCTTTSNDMIRCLPASGDSVSCPLPSFIDNRFRLEEPLPYISPVPEACAASAYGLGSLRDRT